MAMTAWSAKVSTRPICVAEKGRTSPRRIAIAPTATPSQERWARASARTRRSASLEPAYPETPLRQRLQVFGPDRPPLPTAARARAAELGRQVRCSPRGRHKPPTASRRTSPSSR